MDADAIFETFGLDKDYGFVTNPDRGTITLPEQFLIWEALGGDLPALTTTGRLREIINELPVIDATPILENRSFCERAYRLLSFIAHSYIRGRLPDKPLKVLPECIATPWIQIAQVLGTVPIVTYLSTVLYNFRVLNPKESITLENTWTLCTYSGSIDESWFYIISLVIEAESSKFIKLILKCKDSADNGNESELLENLELFAELIKNMKTLLVRMYEENIPAVFNQRIRRYLSGWLNSDTLPDGLTYGNESTPRKLAGGSAAQSPIIQALDIAFGICHKVTDQEDTGVGSVGSYLMEMRNYMSKNHREFLNWFEAGVNLRKSVLNYETSSAIVATYNQCVDAMKAFRDAHTAMVATYIRGTTSPDKEIETKGTGGSNPIAFLKEVRSHMESCYIPSRI